MRRVFLTSILLLAMASLRGEEKTGADVFQMRRLAERPSDRTTPMVMRLGPGEEQVEQVENEVLLRGDAIDWARVEFDRVNRAPVIEVTFTLEGARRFAEVTRTNVGERLGIIINGRLLSAPRIAEEISGGKASISGSFSREEALGLVREMITAIHPLPRTPKEHAELRDREFVFARVRYRSSRHASWSTDYPDADLNITRAWREVIGGEARTAVVKLAADELKEQRFLYMAEGGRLILGEDEAVALREFLLGGGFLMVDDFWGEAEWEYLQGEFRKVFPEQEPNELDLEHPIFHFLYDVGEKPQIPNIGTGVQSRLMGVTWEREDAKEARYWGLSDAAGRLMVVFCHNTDFGDGWERDIEDKYYRTEFSLKKAYPMGLNIIGYALSR